MLLEGRRRIHLALWDSGSRNKVEECQIVGNKTPGIEQYLPELIDDFAGCEISVVQCLRDPLEVAQSILSMPWCGGLVGDSTKEKAENFANYI
ncbi:hypothetical protein GCM10007052_26230 [Halioglobus japonicus]|nr:hypothetical protein GCM10007052_26230 [Halioglobus japonicus]